MKRFLLGLAASILLTTAVAAQQIGPGQVMGNDTAAARAPRGVSIDAILDQALGNTANRIVCNLAGVWQSCAQPILGTNGGTIGRISFLGSTSGTVVLTPQIAAGTPTLTFPTASGTFAVTATAPLTINATTGDVALTTPLAMSFGGSGANLTPDNGGIVWTDANSMEVLANPAQAGRVLQSGNAATPSWSTSVYPSASAAGSMLAALTANTITATRTPVLGLAGTATGSLGFSGSSSGTVTIQPQAGAGTYVFGLPTSAGTAGQPMLSGGGGGAAHTYGTLGIAAGGTSQTTAAAARASAGLNVESMVTNGDSNTAIAATTRTQATSATFTAARTWTLPAANAVNAGQALIISDKFGAINGANTLTVQRAGADTINGGTSFAMTSQFQQVMLVSDGVSVWNYAAAGGGSGTMTSVTPGGGLVSSITASCSQTSITTSGTLSAAECINAQTGTSYAILDSDRGKLITGTNASTQAYTIAQAGAASAFQNGWFADITNKGAGLLTITPTTSTINGAAVYTVPVGNSIRVVSDGTNYQVVGATSHVVSVVFQVFNSTATYTPTPGMLYADSECVAGGGGGGSVANQTGTNTGAGGGGGAGSYCRSRLTAAQIGASKTVTIGAAGAAGTAPGGAGGAGGQSCIGGAACATPILLTNGGAGGASGINGGGTGGGAGGAIGTGDFCIAGGPGGFGMGGTINTINYLGGHGGVSFYGGAGAQVSVNGSLAGQAGAANSGSGGSGAVSNSAGVAVNGGAGGAGKCLIKEYVSQ